MIYIVQPEDTIFSIADTYGISAAYLIQFNEIHNPYTLVTGQTIVIPEPSQIHMVQDGDTLRSIADLYGITMMQLLRNNPFLSQRNSLITGEILIIQYNTEEQIVTNGFTYPYINMKTLTKTLPFLTYISIFNYTAAGQGEIITFEDESSILEVAKVYGVIPLMMISTLSSQGEPNIDVACEILSNQEIQDRNIKNTLAILKSKGYYGVNMVFSYINNNNKDYYFNLIQNISKELKKDGFLFFITINPISANPADIQGIDFSIIEPLVDQIILMRFVWATFSEPPNPVSSLAIVEGFLNNLQNTIPAHKIEIGLPLIGYEWELPYEKGITSVNSLSIDSVLSLAYDVNSTIQFDEASQNPYLYYNEFGFGYPSLFIIWFTDARSINHLTNLITEYKVIGSGIWNIMIFNAQSWLVLVSKFEIVKLISDQIG